MLVDQLRFRTDIPRGATSPATISDFTTTIAPQDPGLMAPGGDAPYTTSTPPTLGAHQEGTLTTDCQRFVRETVYSRLVGLGMVATAWMD